jgi:hypothetical protein
VGHTSLPKIESPQHLLIHFTAPHLLPLIWY